MNNHPPRSRSNPALLALVAVTLAVAAGLAWMLGRDDGTPDRIGAVEQVDAEGEELGAVDLADVASASDEEVGSGARAVVDAPEPLAAPSGWIQVIGRVEAPSGTPIDEQLVVFAVDRRRTLRGLLEPDDLPGLAFGSATEGRETTEDSVMGVALVGRDGSFTLELPSGSTSAHLAVTGRYVYSLATTSVTLPAPREIVLTGELGAWISGTIVPPLEAAAGGARIPAGVEIEFGPDALSGFDMGDIETFGASRDTTTADGGTFELRAVSTAGAYGLLVRPAEFATKLELGIRLEPGEHRMLETVLQQGAVLRGRVVDESGTGIAGAYVDARYRGALSAPVGSLGSATAAEDGTFEIENVTPGVVDLLASAERWLETRERFDFELVDGVVHDDLWIVLSRGASIVGRVEFPDGIAASDVFVTAGADLSQLGGGMTGIDLQRTRGSSATTDEEGRFLLEGLSDSIFALTANLNSSVPEAAGELESEPVDDTVWRARAKGVAPGSEPVLLVLESLGGLEGRVVRADDGEPVESFAARATLAGSGAMFGIGAERRDKAFDAAVDGRFALVGLEPGTWEVEILAQGFATSARLEIDVPRATGTDVPVFELQPAAAVKGVVVDPLGTPVAGASVSVHLELARRIEAMQTGGAPEVFTDVDGIFEFTDLAPGNLNLVADLDGFAASAKVPVELISGAVTQDVVISLRRGGTLTGQVFGDDGLPSKGRMVSIQDMPDYARQRIATTDDDGAFEFASLEPGKWQVAAMPNYMEDDAALDDEGGGSAALFAQLKLATVDIVEDETTHVVLGAPPANPVDLRGRVEHAGEPVAGAMISALPENGGGDAFSRLKMVVTDADGMFELRLDEAGPLHLTVQSGMQSGAQNSIEFVEDVPVGATEHDVVLELPGGTIAGRVTNEDGDPLSGTRVTVTPGGAVQLGNSIGGNHVEVVTDDEGRYEAVYLRTDTYTVSAGGSSFAGVLGGGSPHGRSSRSGVQVDDGARVDSIDFVLAPAVTLTGRVVDGSGTPVEGASIHARGEGGAPVDRIAYVTSDAAGRFSYTGLAAGIYRVSARKGESVSPESAPFAIDSDSSGEPVLALDQGTVLVVRIAGEDGPVHEVRVSVTDDEGREFSGLLSMAELFEDLGRAATSTERRVGPLAPGTYTVTATHPDGRTRSRKVALRDKLEKAVTLRLK